MTTEVGDVIQTRLRLLTELEQAIRAMKDVLEPAARGAPLESERRLNAAPRALENLDSLASQVTDLHSWRVVRDELELRAAQARLEFGQSLEQAFTDAGIPWTGSFPSYRAWKSVRLDVDPSHATVRIGRKVVPVGDAAEIARALLASRKSRPPVAPTLDFETEFEGAYASSAATENLAANDYVSIGKLYEALKKRMPRGYSRPRFARDLADLASRTDRLQFAASRHPRHGMRVPPEDGSLVGSIRLKSP